MKREAGENPARSRHCREDVPHTMSLVDFLPGRREGADESESGDLPVLRHQSNLRLIGGCWADCFVSLPVGLTTKSLLPWAERFFIAESPGTPKFVCGGFIRTMKECHQRRCCGVPKSCCKAGKYCNPSLVPGGS